MKKTTKTTEQSTAVAIPEKNALPSLVVSLLSISKIEFDSLNETIENLGKYSGELDEAGKRAASNVIYNWRQAVLSKLDKKHDDYSRLLWFFNLTEPNNYYEKMSPEYKEILAKKSGTVDMYEKILQIEDRLADEELNKVEGYVDDPDLTVNANLLKRKDVEKDYLIHKMEINKIEKELLKAEKAWKTEMRKHPDIREMLKTGTKVFAAIKKMKAECSDKASLAQLSINVSSQNVRDLLKELIAFEKTIY